MTMYGSLTKKQMVLLNPHAGIYTWEDLPQETQEQILAIKDHEATWSDAQRYLGDLHNPHCRIDK